ncbi:MAG: hypothetical protein NC113_05955 [Bacteroides sp.]|nr:hypothetical protein [Bacteroides sp.]MCM1447751.1 hypothetical protein [Bacteroides sp.]
MGKNKNSTKSVVVIPVYQSAPVLYELASFRQTLTVLSHYDICLITYSGLDLSCYEKVSAEIGKNFHIEYFDKNYFSSVEGYNRLCLATDFYERFLKYDYMLICQLDAWVFSDKLQYWCDKGYDYIGPPTFYIYEQDNREVVHSKDFDGGGNGGFSLRKVTHCLKVLRSNPYLPFLKWSYLLHLYSKLERYRYDSKIIVIARAFAKSIFRGLGYRNTLRYFLRSNACNEDFIFSVYACHSNIIDEVSTPNCKEAALFAFEVHPSYLYDMTGELPFGCHAFMKWEYDSFWKKFINV